MCPTKTTLQKYARLQGLNVSGPWWRKKALEHAARFYFHPGKAQPRPNALALEAMAEFNALLGTPSVAPVWLTGATSCAERYS